METWPLASSIFFSRDLARPGPKDNGRLSDGYGDSITEHVKRTVVYTIYRRVEVTLTRVLVTTFRKFYGQVSRNILCGKYPRCRYALFHFYIESQIFPENPRASGRLMGRALSRGKIGYLPTIQSVNRRSKGFDCLWNDLPVQRKIFYST